MEARLIAGRIRRHPGRDNGLEKQLEPILLDGARDTRDPVHLSMAVRNSFLLVDMNPVAPLVLGGITSDVRGTHDAGDVLRLRLDLHHADTRTDRQGACAPHEPIVTNSLAHALGDSRGLVQRATFEQYSKLIATKTGDRVRSAYARLQQARHVTQQPVSGLVTTHNFDKL